MCTTSLKLSLINYESFSHPARALSCVLLLCVVGCMSATNLTTHNVSGGGPTALLEVRLVEANGCTYGDGDDGGRWFLVWPAGHALRATDIVDGSGAVVARLGQRASLTGGEYHASQLAFLQTLLSNDLPEPCKSEEYWLVTHIAT